MSHGNRNLALARSRYTMTVSSDSGQLVDTQYHKYEELTNDKTIFSTVSQSWQFNASTIYDIDPKYESAVVKLRSLQVTMAPTAVAVTTPAPTLTGHANLDGADDHLEITLPNNTSVLSWSEDWSLAYHMIEIHNPAEGTKRTIATRGDNGMYFSKGSGNWGFYASATDGEYDPASNEGMTHSHGANTWFVPPDDSKHLFTYKASTGKLRWYCNGILKATVQMTSTEMTKGVLSTDKLNVGDQMAGYYGSSYWDGHIDNLLIMTTNLVDNSAQVTEYFSNNDFDTHLEYSDKILSWFKLEPNAETYPAIKDATGDATGQHVGGNIVTSFVTTGEQPAEAQPAVAAVAGEADMGTPEMHFRLNTSLPNNSEFTVSLGDFQTGRVPASSRGPGTVLAVVPTADVYVLTGPNGSEFPTAGHVLAGDVATTGRFVGNTVVNHDLNITISVPLVTNPAAPAAAEASNNAPLFALGPRVESKAVPHGIVHWTAEIEVQLLVNAPDVDSMDLG